MYYLANFSNQDRNKPEYEPSSTGQTLRRRTGKVLAGLSGAGALGTTALWGVGDKLARGLPKGAERLAARKGLAKTAGKNILGSLALGGAGLAIAHANRKRKKEPNPPSFKERVQSRILRKG